MDVVTVTATWSPEADRYTLYVEPQSEYGWTVEPLESTSMAMVLREVDQNEEETGRIAGVEIHAFLEFEHWDDLKKIPGLWRFPGQEPMRLDVLLKGVQERLRKETPAYLRR